MNKKSKSAEDKLEGVRHMIKNIAWNVFKNTGNIDTFLEFKQIKEIENRNTNVGQIIGNTNMSGNSIVDNGIIPTTQKVELNGDNKNQWNNNF